MLWSNCNKLTSFNKNPSLTAFFEPSILNIKIKEARTQVTCKHLHGPKYDKYILRTETWSLGGISPQLHAQLVHQILHYKKHPSLKSSSLIGTSTILQLKLETLGVPDHGNEAVAGRNWTEVEQKRVNDVLKKWAHWEVNFVHRFVHSTACKEMTENHTKICDACRELARDESLKCSICCVSPRSYSMLQCGGLLIISQMQKNEEVKRSDNEQHKIYKAHEKYAPCTFRDVEARNLSDCLKDKAIFNAHIELQRGNTVGCFLQLYSAAVDGKLDNHCTFTDLCSVLKDHVHCQTSSNSNLKFGI